MAKNTPISGGQNGAKTVILAEIILAGSLLKPCCVLAGTLLGENHPHIWIGPFRKTSKPSRRFALENAGGPGKLFRIYVLYV
jgi:hypothetical protein